jgi:hypothetical protein
MAASSLTILNAIAASVMFVLGLVCLVFSIQLRNTGVYPVMYGDKSVYTMSTGSVIGLLAAFCLITTLFQIMYTRNGKQYKNAVAGGVNPFRWVEYSMTASLMAVAVAVLANVQHLSELVTIGIVTGMTMLMGILIETSKNKVLATIIGWVLTIAVWTMIWMSYGEVADQVPDFVTIMTVITFLLFIGFGIIQCVQVGKGFPKGPRFEKAYTSLSLVSKTFLVIIVLVGLIKRDTD